MKDSSTTHFSDLGTCIVVIKSVPCNKCTQCGETVYHLDVGEQIERIVRNLKDSLTEVAIVHYPSTAA